MDMAVTVLIPVVVVVVLALLASVFANRYVRVPPNQVLVVSGRRHSYKTADGATESVGFRIINGGGTFVWPVIERADWLSLETMTIDVNTQEAYTAQGVPVICDGIAQVKIDNTNEAIATAAEQFLNKSMEEIKMVATQTLEGHLRGILSTLTVEEINNDRDKFAQKAQAVATNDLANMGLKIISFTIRDIRDKKGYLEALGRTQIANVQRNAQIGEAEAQRDATIRSAQAQQLGEQAKFQAQTQIAEADRNYSIKRSEYQVDVQTKQAQQDLAYAIQEAITKQEVVKQQVQVDVIKREKEIEVAHKEVELKQRRLQAEIEKQAEAERFRVQQQAEAEKFKTQTEAYGKAEAIKATGDAEAYAIRQRGLAEAEIIKAKLEAEADGMTKKAEAYKQYNDAAVTQMVIERLPEIAAAISGPLAKTEKMVIVNTGTDGGGISKMTGDVIKVMAQVPEMVNALTGIDLASLVKKQEGVNKQDVKD